MLKRIPIIARAVDFIYYARALVSGTALMSMENMTFVEGVIVGISLFIIGTVLAYRFTESKWSWILGAILGLVVGLVFSLLPLGTWTWGS